MTISEVERVPLNLVLVSLKDKQPVLLLTKRPLLDLQSNSQQAKKTTKAGN